MAPHRERRHRIWSNRHSRRRGRAITALSIALVVLAAACSDSGSDEPQGAADQGGATTTGGPPTTGGAPSGGGNTSGGVDVFAPPELTRALEQLTTTYEQQFPGTTFAFTFASGEELRDRVEDDEPDIYINTANLVAPVAQGDQAEGEIVEFGSDILQLIVARGNPKAVDGLAVFGADSPVVAGLCEDTAPCGPAGTQVLEAAGVTPAPDVLSPGGPELLETIVAGRADAGLIYRSDARSRLRRISSVPTPSGAGLVRYQMLLMQENAPATAFIEWLQTSESARQVLRARGLLSFYGA